MTFPNVLITRHPAFFLFMSRWNPYNSGLLLIYIENW